MCKAEEKQMEGLSKYLYVKITISAKKVAWLSQGLLTYMRNLLCSFRILSHPRDHSGKSMSTAWMYLDCFKKSYHLFWIEFGFSVF